MSPFSLRRLVALWIKEVIQMRRDRITFAMMLGVPLMQLVLFGFAINNDPKGLPAALVAPTQDRYTRAIVSALELTGYYRFGHVGISATEAISDPTENSAFHLALCLSPALTRKSNDTPRSISPMSISVTGR